MSDIVRWLRDSQHYHETAEFLQRAVDEIERLRSSPRRCAYPGSELLMTAEELELSEAWKQLPKETCPFCIDGQCRRTREVRA
jgi:hypothetical protein